MERIETMRCYLHVGTEKTATKTIQSFLDVNRRRLKQEGFVYPAYRPKRDDNYWCHALLGYNPGHRDEFTQFEHIHTAQELECFQRRECARLQRSLRGGSKGAEQALILSSELFQSRLTSRDELLRLKETLTRLGVDRFSIVVYLRNPSELINSHYSTVIKTGGVNELPSLPEHPYAHNLCNHQATMERFSDVFGEDALIPRLFDKTTLKDGSVIHDFCEAVGIPMDDTYQIPEDANESLSAFGVHLLRRVNVQLPRFDSAWELNPWRGNILAYFSGQFTDSKYVMPDWLWTRYDEAFAASNEWVRARYFPARTSLFPQRNHPKETLLPIADAEMDRMADFVVSIWRAHRKLVIRRKQLLKIYQRFAVGIVVLLVVGVVSAIIINC
jgi:hypothetical protein